MTLTLLRNQLETNLSEFTPPYAAVQSKYFANGCQETLITKRIENRIASHNFSNSLIIH